MNGKDRSGKISLLLVAALVLSGCGTETDAAQEASSAIAVKAAEAELGTLAVSNQFIGTVSPQQQVSIIPLVSGEVDAVYAEVGDEVEAGEVLFHIKDDAARLQKESAELSKQGAELSAQMQLGSAQVMNNISMQSNIRSLEYQLEMAKDQYNTAVNGVADAQEAREEMNKAIDEINRSVSGLQSSQKEMEGVISRAKEYAKYDLLKGEYVYETAYNRPLDPDHYTWKDERTEQESENGQDQTEADDMEDVETSLSGLGMPAAGFSSYEQEKESESAAADKEALESAGEKGGQTDFTGSAADGSENAAEQAGTSGNAAEQTGTAGDASNQAGTPGGTAENEDISGGGTDPAAQTGQQEDTAETEADGADADRTEGASEGTVSPESSSSEKEAEIQTGEDTEASACAALYADTAYFSIELVREDAPQYLAIEEDTYIPKLSETTKAEAWEAYERQQRIDSAERAAMEIGYSAKDVKTGKADAEMLENSAKIVALQYQASQLQSNQTTVDSSIKSAEAAKDTTAKTIDFYEDNLANAQTTYGISNGQAYQDTASALATQIQAADVGVRSAQMQLEYYSPTTPISGTVVSRTVEQYGLVQPGYAAYVISNQDAMNVTFAVSGRVKETLKIGMPVTLEKSGNTYNGTITEIGETVDAQSGGLFLVKAITEADGDKLAGGTAVKLTVDTYRSENAVLLPYDAVHFESEQAYVFVISDHKAVRTPVTIGLMNDDIVEITEGLKAGEQVVATWSSQLEDGAEVRIIGESKSMSGSDGALEQEDASDSEGREADE